MAKRSGKILYKGAEYRSYKHPVLEYIFNQKTSNGTVGIGEDHEFTIKDVGNALAACGIPSSDRASWSNIILDLTRKDLGIESRLPTSIVALGYDLKKKTGPASDGTKYSGVFVYVGVGNTVNTWLVWPEIPDKVYVIENKLPPKIMPYLGKDEGALFSVIDYCDVLSLAIYEVASSVLRVQNPKKWQPNEVDGLYFSDYIEIPVLFPVEAKALSTGDAINLEQMSGAYRTIKAKIPDIEIVPLGIKMVENGMRIAVFEGEKSDINFHQYILVTFDPPIDSWRVKRKKSD